MSKQHQQIPKLRFPEFEGEWIPTRVSQLLERFTDPVEVEQQKVYREIGVRSHGKGIFHKTPIKGKKLGNKRVFWVHPFALVINIVFAWEQAVALTSDEEKGMIASHRFPMFLPKENKSDLDLLRYFFLTKSGKHLLGLASPGGAGRNKTLGQGTFAKLKLPLPTLPEQRKIAAFLSAVDRRIDLQRQYLEQLRRYKQGAMQQIFSQEIRFQDENGKDFPAWEEKKLGEVLYEHKTKNKELMAEEVFSVSKQKGVVNQIEHLGRSYASSDTSNYKVSFHGDIIYTKSPTSDFPYGIIKQNQLNRTGILSVLYAVFTPSSNELGDLLHNYFSSWQNTFNYLHPLVHKGAKNTMNIGNKDFLNGRRIPLPSSQKEIEKITSFLSSLDVKIDQAQEKLGELEWFKRGLLQGMFV